MILNLNLDFKDMPEGSSSQSFAYYSIELATIQYYNNSLGFDDRKRWSELNAKLLMAVNTLAETVEISEDEAQFLKTVFEGARFSVIGSGNIYLIESQL